MKFADWYAVAFATDEEKEMVYAVKLPSHNNLATCSFKLGNHQHAVVHCSQVLEHEPDNVKALYRRGACQLRLGYLEQARIDLQRAAKLAPTCSRVLQGFKERAAQSVELMGKVSSVCREDYELLCASASAASDL